MSGTATVVSLRNSGYLVYLFCNSNKTDKRIGNNYSNNIVTVIIIIFMTTTAISLFLSLMCMS